MTLIGPMVRSQCEPQTNSGGHLVTRLTCGSSGLHGGGSDNATCGVGSEVPHMKVLRVHSQSDCRLEGLQSRLIASPIGATHCLHVRVPCLCSDCCFGCQVIIYHVVCYLDVTPYCDQCL